MSVSTSRRDGQDELDALNAALVADLENVARALLGEPNRSHSNKVEWRWGNKGSRALQMRSTGGAARGSWFDHSANEGGGVFRMIKDALGCSWADAFRWARSRIGRTDVPAAEDRPKGRKSDPVAIALEESEAEANRAGKVRRAREFWRQRTPIAGTPAAAYLASRALQAPPGAWPDCIAFLPGRHHGLIVAGTNDAGAIDVVQVVHLDPTGRKATERPGGIPPHWQWAAKQSFGAPQGAPVRLPGAADGPLLLAEGPETGLSVWSATGHETWVALGSLSNIAPPAGRLLIVCRDDDRRFSPADRKLTATVKTWREVGHKVRVALPWPERREDGTDFNDLLQHDGAAAVRTAIEDVANPTSPDGRRRLPRDKARRVLEAATAAFFAAVAEHDPTQVPPVHAIRVDVGLGKSLAARMGAAALLARLRAAGDRTSTIVFAVPTHALAEEQALAFESLPAARAAGLTAGIWRGRNAPDPDAPGKAMCLDPDAVADAHAAGAQVQSAVCRGRGPDGATVQCRFFASCGYQRQRQRKADAWFVAHELLFQEKPAAIGDVVALVVDESLWQAGLEGIASRQATLTLDSLATDFSIRGDAIATARLEFLRRQLSAALAGLSDGPIPRDVIETTGLTPASAAEARRLEWRRKVDPKMYPGMPVAARKAAVHAVEGNRTIRRLVALWHGVEALLRDGGPRASGWVALATEREEKGSVRVLRFKGRKTVREGWQAPTLVIDATLSIELVRAFWPHAVLTADVAAATPHQHIAQVVDVSFSKRRLLAWDGASDADKKAAKNLRNLHAVAGAFARAHAPRPVLLVVQKAVEEALPSCGPLPPNVILAHHNGVAGRDQWTMADGRTIKGADLAGLMVVGRTLPGPASVEQLAEAVTGSAIDPVSGWYPRLKTMREMADGDHLEAEADRHPDPMAEACRWQICEGELEQIIGRGRGVNRDADNPLDVLILTDVPVSVPVDQVLTLGSIAPSPRDLMLAAGGIAYENPTEAAKAYPLLWTTRKRAKDAFEYAVQREVGRNPVLGTLLLPDSGQPRHDGSARLRRIDYQRVGTGKSCVIAWFDPFVVPDPVAALVTAVGPLASCKVELVKVLPLPAVEIPERPAMPSPTYAPAELTAPRLSGQWTIRGAYSDTWIAADEDGIVVLRRPPGQGPYFLVETSDIGELLP